MEKLITKKTLKSWGLDVSDDLLNSILEPFPKGVILQVLSKHLLSSGQNELNDCIWEYCKQDKVAQSLLNITA